MIFTDTLFRWFEWLLNCYKCFTLFSKLAQWLTSPFQILYKDQRDLRQEKMQWSSSMVTAFLTISGHFFDNYRDSSVSAVFWTPRNCTIWKTLLIGECFSTKMTILDFWIFRVHFFSLLNKCLIRKPCIYCSYRD